MGKIFIFLLIFTACVNAHFEEPVQNLDIPQDAKIVVLIYEFKNNTDKLLKYLDVRSDCNCEQIEIMPADAAKDGFKPGDVGILQVVIQVPHKVNQTSLYVQFQSGEMIDTFKLTARLNRLPRVVLSSDKLYVNSGRANAIHRVKSMSGSLAAYRLRFDEKAVECRIENDCILIRGLRKGSSREFVEIIESKEDNELVAGILEINFDYDR
jgi:hypothetical protein